MLSMIATLGHAQRPSKYQRFESGAKMAGRVEKLYAEKHSIVQEFFIGTADDNYVAARWCFHSDLNVDFLWLSVHCLEKYLKAALLLNGHSAKKYRHDITALYSEVKLLAPELLPDTLQKPERMPDKFWHAETMEGFLRRLYGNGNADNRYMLYGYIRMANDLFKLDQAVFSIRRLCQPLEAHFLGENHPGYPDKSRRQRMLIDHKTSWRLNSNLEEIIVGKRGKILRDAALKWNHCFAPSNYRQAPANYAWSSRNSIIFRRVYEPLEAGPKHYKKADQLWDWMKSNIQLPKALIKNIESERDKLKKENQ